MLRMHHHRWDVVDQLCVVEGNPVSHSSEEHRRDQNGERPPSGQQLLPLELLLLSSAETSLRERPGCQLDEPVQWEGHPVRPGLGGTVHERFSSRAVFESSCVIRPYSIRVGAGNIRQERRAIHWVELLQLMIVHKVIPVDKHVQWQAQLKPLLPF